MSHDGDETEEDLIPFDSAFEICLMMANPEGVDVYNKVLVEKIGEMT